MLTFSQKNNYIITSKFILSNVLATYLSTASSQYIVLAHLFFFSVYQHWSVSDVWNLPSSKNRSISFQLSSSRKLNGSSQVETHSQRLQETQSQLQETQSQLVEMQTQLQQSNTRLHETQNSATTV